MTTSPECIRTDIAVNDDCVHAPFYCCSEGLAQHSGIAACELVKGYTRKLPGMTSMVLLLKQYLYERGLNNSYTGGLSSYCLTLMVISYLQLFQGNAIMGVMGNWYREEEVEFGSFVD
jgi:DNA polymerase sigma